MSTRARALVSQCAIAAGRRSWRLASSARLVQGREGRSRGRPKPSSTSLPSLRPATIIRTPAGPPPLRQRDVTSLVPTIRRTTSVRLCLLWLRVVGRAGRVLTCRGPPFSAHQLPFMSTSSTKSPLHLARAALPPSSTTAESSSKKRKRGRTATACKVRCLSLLRELDRAGSLTAGPSPSLPLPGLQQPQAEVRRPAPVRRSLLVSSRGCRPLLMLGCSLLRPADATTAAGAGSPRRASSRPTPSSPISRPRPTRAVRAPRAQRRLARRSSGRRRARPTGSAGRPAPRHRAQRARSVRCQRTARPSSRS